MLIVDRLSMYIVIGLCLILSSVRMFDIAFIFFIVCVRAINSASVEDKAMIGYFLVDHAMGPLLSMSMKPVVEFLFMSSAKEASE